jgi:hypothetical protein
MVSGSSSRRPARSPASDSRRTASRLPHYRISIAHKTSHSLEEEARSIRPNTFYIPCKVRFGKDLLEKNIEYLHKYLPQAWIVALEGGSECSAVQQTAEAAKLILEFFNKRLERELEISSALLHGLPF